MIYLDYSATTPVNKEVLDSFNRACIDYPGNANSIHSLGVKSNELIKACTRQISEILNIKENEIIYTSGSSESNNLAIKGICEKYKNKGKHIITTKFEHSSIYGPISYLQKQGFEVDFVSCKEDGTVDVDNLKSLIRDDTILVSITAINSEIGIINPIDEIKELLKNYPKIFFHVDMTQSMGKYKVNFDGIDLISMSAHKIYGMKGIGLLIKKEKVQLEPLIHGGKSTTIYRAGTPPLPLVVSLAKALRLAYEDIDKKYDYVKEINSLLKEKLSTYKDLYINSNDKCTPYVLNISVVGVKPETFVHALEQYEVYISTQTACASSDTLSKSVLELTKSEERASSSMRISLSSITTKEEINEFLKIFDICYRKLKN